MILVPKSPMPAVRGYSSTAVIGNRLYIIGGEDSAGHDTNTLWEWNESTDTWTIKSPLPNFPLGTPNLSAQAGAAVIGNIIYLAGGTTIEVETVSTPTYGNALWDWNQALNSWSQDTSFPAVGNRGRMWPAVGSIGNKIYVVGGYTLGSIFTSFPYVADTLYEWDQGSGTWSVKAPLPSARYFAGCCTIGTKLYVVGGSDGTIPFNSGPLFEWDQATNTWSAKSAMPSLFNSSVYNSVVAIGTTIYAGGYAASWDQLTDTWTLLDRGGGFDTVNAIGTNIYATFQDQLYQCFPGGGIRIGSLLVS